MNQKMCSNCRRTKKRCIYGSGPCAQCREKGWHCSEKRIKRVEDADMSAATMYTGYAMTAEFADSMSGGSNVPADVARSESLPSTDLSTYVVNDMLHLPEYWNLDKTASIPGQWQHGATFEYNRPVEDRDYTFGESSHSSHDRFGPQLPIDPSIAQASSSHSHLNRFDMATSARHITNSSSQAPSSSYGGATFSMRPNNESLPTRSTTFENSWTESFDEEFVEEHGKGKAGVDAPMSSKDPDHTSERRIQRDYRTEEPDGEEINCESNARDTFADKRRNKGKGRAK